jgi:hypothetical protein
MFKLLYDARSTNPIDWWDVAFGGLLVAFAFISLAINWRGKRTNYFPLAVAAFSVAWILIVAGLPWLTWHKNASLLRSGKYRVVQGRAEPFCSQKDGKLEEFVVGGHMFSYSQFESLGRFHTPRAFGGPIRNGIYLRISYVDDDDIVRLEERIDRVPREPAAVQLVETCS